MIIGSNLLFFENLPSTNTHTVNILKKITFLKEQLYIPIISRQAGVKPETGGIAKIVKTY